MTGLGRIGLVAVRELRAERREPDGIVAAVTFIAVLVLLESLVVGPVVARDADQRELQERAETYRGRKQTDD